MPHEKKFTPETEADLIRRYTAGESSSALATEYDTSVLTVTRIIRRNGGEVRSRHANRLTTPEQDAEIAALYEQGVRTAQLAAQFNLPIKHIAKIVARQGGELRRKGPNRLSDEQEQELLALYEAGATSDELASRYGIYRSTVPRIVRRLQGQVNAKWRRAPRKFTDEEIAEMARLWESGTSQNAIAKQFGVGQVVVSRVLQRAGVESHPGKRPGAARGANNPRWKGGRIDVAGGYKAVWIPPDDEFASMRNRTGYVMEHRLVMAESLGRPLDDHETVHHVNGQRDCNDISNLQLRQGRHGNGVVHRCRVCGSTDIESTRLADLD
jgi:DNA invertase Pin-like site-specific DNA recombinase